MVYPFIPSVLIAPLLITFFKDPFPYTVIPTPGVPQLQFTVTVLHDTGSDALALYNRDLAC